MSLLWTKAIQSQYDEEHHEHSLHPLFHASGMKQAPCAYTRCSDWDKDHSDAFDEAEGRSYEMWADNKRPPIERVDLSKGVHGFEPVCDHETLHRYTHSPETRKGGAPIWFRHKGEHYIMDGHHGTAAALHRGDTHLDVHMIDLDKD